MPTGPSKKSVSSHVSVKVDPKRKAAYESLHRQMLTSSRTEARGFDAFWEAVGEIVDGELYVDGGYETADDFVLAEVKEPLRTAYRKVRVARLASPADEDRWSASLLDAAIAYLDAKTGGPVKGKLPVSFAALRIPVKTDAGVKRLGLDKLDVETVRRATRELRKGKSAHGPTASPAEEKLRAGLSEVRGLEHATVSVTDGTLRLGGVPLYALRDVGRALVALADTLDAPAPAKAAVKKTAKTAKRATVTK